MGNKIKNLEIVAGCNRILNTTEELNKFIHKTYDAECGSGFYAIRDIDIAAAYANTATFKFGGKAYVNFFELNVKKLIEDGIKIYYFNNLNIETMEYLSFNVNGKLSPHCSLNRYRNLRPVDVCMNCKDINCKWNSEYIQAILLDCIDINLTDIFIDYFDKKININQASKLIYEELDNATDGKFKFQIVLRGKILDLDNGYLKFIRALPANI